MSVRDTSNDRPWMNPEVAREAIRSGDGTGVRIAIIDSGIDTTHPNLQTIHITDSVSVSSKRGDIVVAEDPCQDCYGHGTAVAGIIHQVAPNAEIGIFQVIGKENESRSAIISAGVTEAIRRGYHILNCSFGSPGTPRSIMTYKRWIDQAYVSGIHVVSACNNFDFSTPEWPSHFSSVISVNMAGSQAQSDDIFYRKGTLIEFLALGENVEVPWLGGTSKKVIGSSFAAPRVTGTIARLLTNNPSLSPALVSALLQNLAIREKCHI